MRVESLLDYQLFPKKNRKKQKSQSNKLERWSLWMRIMSSRWKNRGKWSNLRGSKTIQFLKNMCCCQSSLTWWLIFATKNQKRVRHLLINKSGSSLLLILKSQKLNLASLSSCIMEEPLHLISEGKIRLTTCPMSSSKKMSLIIISFCS